MKKIIIIGITGSGKTSLAKKISEKLNIPICYLDLIFWNENGHLKDDEFTKEQEKIMENDRWIIDGGFPKSKSLEVRIRNADTIIFYDLPLLLVFWRQLKRYIEYRNKIRPDLGNKQGFPFTWKDIKYALNYPTKEIYAKLAIYPNKKILIIKNLKDEVSLLQEI